MRRVRLARVALERLADRVGLDLPWSRPGAAPPATDAELRRIGLLDRGDGLFPELVAALGVVARPEVLVDVDVAVVRPRPGPARLHSWHRRAGGRVTVISSAGGAIELAWGEDHAWRAELARAVTHDGSPGGPAPDRPPPPSLDLPHELLLAAGAALAERRPDLLRELATRHGTDPDVVRRLHTAARGRMRTTVTSTRATGWVAWVRYDDGWRSLTPWRRGTTPMVRVGPVTPDHLGVEVAALVARVAA